MMGDKEMDDDSSSQKPNFKDFEKLSKSERDRLVEKFYTMDDEDGIVKNEDKPVDKKLF